MYMQILGYQDLRRRLGAVSELIFFHCGTTLYFSGSIDKLLQARSESRFPGES